MDSAYISLGSNLGNRLGNVAKALSFLARDPRVKIQKISSLYRTAPVQARPQPAFLNAVVHIKTSMLPEQLLRCLQGIEKRLGRVRTGKNAPRTVDMDILEYGKTRIARADLVIPHPRMLTRKFVLAPLAEVRSRGTLVANGATARSMLRDKAVSSQSVEPIGGVKLLVKKYVDLRFL